MRPFALGLLCAVVTAVAASANAPATSLRPVARGEVHPDVIRPINPRVVGVKPVVAPPDRSILYRSLRPKMRPVRSQAAPTRRISTGQVAAICGDPQIIGEHVGVVPGALSGCGVADAVRVRSVSGVALTTGALVDCTTARALKNWVDRGLKPAFGRKGGGVEKMRVLASYACRSRNSQKGAKISEHGRGRAIDIGAFILRDGTEVTVLKDWGNGKSGRILRKAHEAACGPFGTVLGPKSDRFHKDHFHFDTARYRGGSYCK